MLMNPWPEGSKHPATFARQLEDCTAQEVGTVSFNPSHALTSFQGPENIIQTI